ncbi:Crp/Fnr family transcriptional regulator [Geminicoccus flavidas]|uniref:Crp/Fnr family transcriptional regulator n=1 Tax=Geminicoccus flavidas TaxID=2506407 RepID=UPI00135B13EA|nr:Crp/Fnr family transcriptional regulator [Geminicoccus flavidas]
MDNPLARKLSHFTRLSASDQAALDLLSRQRVRQVNARHDLIREGDRPDHVNLILSGWACRYKTLEDGRRQIIAILLPGDLCDLNIFILRTMDHSMAAITPVTHAEVSREVLEEVTLKQPRITQALWWDALVTAAIQREWSVSLGQRTALERVGHILCELFVRLRMVGLTNGNCCEFPITQVDLADATGLSAVHLNRTLQELRAGELIVLRDRLLTIRDLPALQVLSLFNPNYLHLDAEGQQYGANEP